MESRTSESNIINYNERLDQVGWFIYEDAYACGTASLNDFINAKKLAENYFEERMGRGFNLTIQKKELSDTLIGSISITIHLNSRGNVDFYTLGIGSQSSNDEIFKQFKSFGERFHWSNYSNGNKDNWCELMKISLYTPQAVDIELNLVKKFDPHIPDEVITQIKLACGLTIAHNYAMLQLANTCFDKNDLQHAFDAYQQIDKNDLEVYREARYRMAKIKESSPHLSENVRERVKSCLPFYIEAIGYKDSMNLCKKMFNYLCTGSYENNTVPFPEGATPESTLLLAECIYQSLERINALMEENKNLKNSFMDICKPSIRLF